MFEALEAFWNNKNNAGDHAHVMLTRSDARRITIIKNKKKLNERLLSIEKIVKSKSPSQEDFDKLESGIPTLKYKTVNLFLESYSSIPNKLQKALQSGLSDIDTDFDDIIKKCFPDNLAKILVDVSGNDVSLWSLKKSTYKDLGYSIAFPKQVNQYQKVFRDYCTALLKTENKFVYEINKAYTKMKTDKDNEHASKVNTRIKDIAKLLNLFVGLSDGYWLKAASDIAKHSYK